MSKSEQIALLGFVPALVVQYLTNRKQGTLLPDKQSFTSVVMFADISGFTNLTETLSKIGPEGAELIAFAINRYMELLVSAVSKSGGDIFKFAGDAMIVVWPPSHKESLVDQYEELRIICRQAIQSALDIQAKLDNTTILEDIKLSVKIGFGIGEISIIYVGGVFGRSEYLATGDPLTQAFQSEHQATSGGQIIVSRQVFEMIKDYFIFETNDNLKSGFKQVVRLVSKVRLKADALLIKNQLGNFGDIRNHIISFIPAAVIPYFQLEQEKWASELRTISVLFINLGIDLSDAYTTQGLQRIQLVIEIVQKCIYMHEGSLNKLLMDDKGSTLIVCFGLPPLMHQDDACRAILAGQLLISQLAKLSCNCSIGISTGTVFTGVVGTSGSRREYSVLGDSVNLAARLMQLSLTQSRGLLVCEHTAKLSQHKILCRFWQEVSLKGKIGLIPVFEVSAQEHPVLRTHYHTIPNTRKEENEFERRVTLGGYFDGLIGQHAKIQRIKEIISTFLQLDQEGRINQDTDTERDFLIVKGGFGVGKSFVMRCILNQIREEWQQTYKYGERVLVIEVSLNSIERTQKMNAFRKILQKIYSIINLKMLQNELLQQVASGSCLQLLEELLGMRERDVLGEFPSQGDSLNDQIQKQVASAVIKIFEMYFEIVLKKGRKKANRFRHSLSISQNLYEDHNESQDSVDEIQSLDLSVEQQFQMECTVAPIIICCDDLQYYDGFSFYLLKTVIKKFARILCIGISRDNFWEIPLISRKESTQSPNRYQEQIYDKGLESILKLYNVTPQEVILKGFTLSGNNDQKKLLELYFGFKCFIKEESQISQGRQIKRSVQIERKFDHLMLQQEKYIMMREDFDRYITYYLHLKTNGQPLLLIDLINNLIRQGLIVIDGDDQKCLVTQDLQQILIHDQWLQVAAPITAVKMNSPTIDSLGCVNLLLLKFASVIGDIFDIQTLNRIVQLKHVNHTRLLASMRQLSDKDIIEFMHEEEGNRFYRFMNPFMREVLYQRMTYSQRRVIHALVAEAFQTIPRPFDYDENLELLKLEYHWRIAEQRISIKQTKLVQKYSHKAKKSLIVKRISKLLAEDPQSVLRKGYLFKRSDKTVSWQRRYCVLDRQVLILYRNEEMNDLTTSIPIKRITGVNPIFEEIVTPPRSPFGLNVSVSTWVKQDREQKSRRNFLFAFSCEEELEEWAIYIEFAKAKAVYDDFVSNFGKIQLPINLAQESYDQVMALMVSEMQKSKRQVSQQTQQNSVQRRKGSVMQTPMITKIIPPVPATSSVISPPGKRFSVRFSAFNGEMEEKMEGAALKDRVKEFIGKSLLVLFMHMISHSSEQEYLVLGQNGKYMRRQERLFQLHKISSLMDFQLG